MKKPSRWPRIAAMIGAAMLFVGSCSVAKPPLDATPEVDPCHAVAEAGTSACTTGNHLELLVDGPAYQQKLISEIDRAQSSVWLNVFQLQDDPTSGTIVDALLRAQERGVDVRVVVDNRESSGDFKGDPHVNSQVQRLIDAGIAVARPTYGGYRVNHRKVVVIDGDRAFESGANIGGNYLLPRENGWSYHDATIFVRGPAVRDIAAVFVQSLVDAGGPRLELPPRMAAIPDAPFADAQTQIVWHRGGADRYIEREYVQRIDAARDRVVVMNGFSMTDEVADAMIRAHERGVSVTWIWGRVSNDGQIMAQDSINRLIAAGVPVLRFEGPLHMKAALFDDVVIIGSSNIDGFSMWRNDEMVLQVKSQAFANEADQKIFTPALVASPRLSAAPTDFRDNGSVRAFVVEHVVTPLVNR